jgi:hypothetical protein
VSAPSLVFSSEEVRAAAVDAVIRSYERSTPHRFESISEQQWKAGKPRHLCNLCDLDYSDPIHVDE